MSSISKNNLTPTKLPLSPAANKWYSVTRSSQNYLDVVLTPTAKKRQPLIYTWRVYFKDGSYDDYTGKTIQKLSLRCKQHIKTSKKSIKMIGVFHRFLKEYAENLPGSQVIKIRVGISRIVPAGESLSKTEQLFISKQNLPRIQKRKKCSIKRPMGLNRIHAKTELADRIAKGRIKIKIDKAVTGCPRQLIIKRKP